MIVGIVIAAFIQTTLLPINLCLLILLVRTFTTSKTKNLILAFGTGLLVSYLNYTTLGVHSLLFLSLVATMQLLSKSRISTNYLSVFPFTLVLLILYELIIAQVYNQSFVLLKVFLEAFLSIPLYLMMRFIEDRLSVKDLKLRL